MGVEEWRARRSRLILLGLRFLERGDSLDDTIAWQGEEPADRSGHDDGSR